MKRKKVNVAKPVPLIVDRKEAAQDGEGVFGRWMPVFRPVSEGIVREEKVRIDTKKSETLPFFLIGPSHTIRQEFRCGTGGRLVPLNQEQVTRTYVEDRDEHGVFYRPAESGEAKTREVFYRLRKGMLVPVNGRGKK